MPVIDEPCEWPLLFACEGSTPPASEGCEHLGGLTPENRAAVEQMAVNFLWNWTARMFGACPVTIRPCKQDCHEGDSTWNGATGAPVGGGGVSTGPWTPVILRGNWYNLGCGQCGDNCGCTSTPSVRLPGPVAGIESVIIDGVTLDPSAHRVDNANLLVRQDGGIWPVCQDMSRPAGEPGTWSVTFLLGTIPPVGGQIAAGRLACELAKALCGDKSCGLPERVQTVTRQGVTVTLLDAFDDIDTGHTGIWVIDSWIASVTKRPRGWSVTSPDRRGPRYRQQTWPVA